MLPNFQNNTCVSPEYNGFLEEYCKLLKYSVEISQILVLIRTLEKGNTQLIPLYNLAVEAYFKATATYIRMLAIREQLFQKYWNNIH
ncbi:hypothetical protein [Scytonema sp. NUACC26]|uniref:hypothetical protein n=1 Tax=Scytonema sp. NUACC26 TaxID=3140176 RepID=UPI0034DCA130